MTALIKYDAACRALAEAKAVDEVKDLRDKAEAMRIYAMQAKNKTLEVDAAEIRIRAERRLGEMISKQKETVGLNRGTVINGAMPGKNDGSSAVVADDHRPTLADVGVSKDLSSRAQKLAAVPEEEFEAEVGEWRERVQAEGARVTTRLEAAGERAINKTQKEEQKPECFEADENEIFIQMQQMQEELESLRKIVEADDRLKAANEEITRLKAVERALQSRVNELMNKDVEQIKKIKALQSKLNRQETNHV